MKKKHLISIKNKNYGERRHYVSVRVSNSLLFFFLILACIVLKALPFNLQLDLNINMIFLSSDLKVISIAKVWKYVQYQTDTNSTNMVISFQTARTHNLYHCIYFKSHESLRTNVVYDQGCILMRIWSNWSRSQSHFHERGTYLNQTWSICLTWIVLVMLCVLYVLLLVLIWDMEILVINSAFPFNCYC